MICIKCGHRKTAITNSRYFATKHQTWRRRQCTQCGTIFTTYESLSLDQLTVEGEPFQEVRLLLSISRSLEHHTGQRAVTTQELTHTVIDKLITHITSTSGELQKAVIAEITYTTLKHYDRLASVQYAARHSSHLKKYLR